MGVYEHAEAQMDRMEKRRGVIARGNAIIERTSNQAGALVRVAVEVDRRASGLVEKWRNRGRTQAAKCALRVRRVTHAAEAEPRHLIGVDRRSAKRRLNAKRRAIPTAAPHDMHELARLFDVRVR